MKTGALFALLCACATVGFSQAPAAKPVAKPVAKPTSAQKPQPAKAANPVGSPITLKNGIDSLSYAIGILDAGFFKQQGIDTMNYEALKTAVKSVIENKPTLMDAQMANEVLRQKLQEAAQKKVQPNIDEGKRFLAENKKRAGVTTTESGLQYEVVKMGEGSKPTADNTVKVHYTGTLLNGTKFDSSRDRGEPAQFPLSGVIRGWTEGVQLMPAGSIFKFYIPYEMAYGLQGSPPVIPGGATLVFEVELIEIVK